jgi:hypothetical protein
MNETSSATWSVRVSSLSRPRAQSSPVANEPPALAGVRRVRSRGFEPPRTIRSTRPSTLANGNGWVAIPLFEALRWPSFHPAPNLSMRAGTSVAPPRRDRFLGTRARGDAWPKAIYARRAFAYKRRPARPVSAPHRRRPWAVGVGARTTMVAMNTRRRACLGRSRLALRTGGSGPPSTSPGAAIARAVRRVPTDPWLATT